LPEQEPLKKHAAARLDTYITVHNNWMKQLSQEGLILDHNLDFAPIPGTPFLTLKGDIFLEGSLKMHVNKTLRVSKVRGEPYVQTVEYAYNLSLIKVGNIFRYDNMHAHYGHQSKDHRHQYEPPGERKRLDEIRDKDDVPTLGEALNEAREYLDWHEKYRPQTDEPVVEVPSEISDY
jgi:hypothetical protein